jgi:hypothetical protein
LAAYNHRKVNKPAVRNSSSTRWVIGQRIYAQKASDGNGLQAVRRPGSKHQSDIRAHSLVTSEDIEALQAESEGKKAQENKPI